MSALLRRDLALAALAALAIGIVVVRLAAAPTAAGYRYAVAAAPGDAIYTAGSAGFGTIAADGSGRRIAASPAAAPLSLSAAGPDLVLGAEDGVYVSADAGAHWRRALRARHVLAVAVGGGVMLAAAWAQGVWASADSGQTWQAAALPDGDLEIESLAAGAGRQLAATQLGLLESSDGGLHWQCQPGVGDRLTAVSIASGEEFAADWRGQVYSGRGGALTPAGRVPGGVWALAGSVPYAATTAGLYEVRGDVPGALSGLEVTSVVLSGSALYAVLAGGGLMVKAGSGWRSLGKV